jgi:hypothetical protein
VTGPVSADQVVFGSSDLAPVGDLVRRFTTAGNDITRWVDVRPLRAVLGGWDGQFTAVGVDSRDDEGLGHRP